jgi:hypothetical protein
MSGLAASSCNNAKRLPEQCPASLNARPFGRRFDMMQKLRQQKSEK